MKKNQFRLLWKMNLKYAFLDLNRCEIYIIIVCPYWNPEALEYFMNSIKTKRWRTCCTLMVQSYVETVLFWYNLKKSLMRLIQLFLQKETNIEQAGTANKWKNSIELLFKSKRSCWCVSCTTKLLLHNEFYAPWTNPNMAFLLRAITKR